MEHPLGAQRLIECLNLPMTGRLRHTSVAGSRSKDREENGYFVKIYPFAQAPADDDIRGHFLFHLKQEVPNFEFLSRFFTAIGSTFAQEWVNDEPTGEYSRRTAFFYEFFTGESLTLPENLGRKYIFALDSKKIVTASTGKEERSTRWRVWDNMPGTRFFCPSIVKTDKHLKEAFSLDINALLKGVEAEFGQEAVTRASIWMTSRESRASFEIEHETDNASKIQRFASVLATQTGQGVSPPLSCDSLAQLQKSIIGSETVLTTFGLRKSPVFVGDGDYFLAPEERVHYIAPPPEDLALMLEGIQVFLKRTEGQSAIMRAAVTAFGFVYIHPLADGNGRVHRFLINDILHRDCALESGMILPISAVITADSVVRRAYDQVLETISLPLLHQIKPFIHFLQKAVPYPDGIFSDLEFGGNEIAEASWRYPKLESHIIFTSEIVRRSIEEYLYNEVAFLRRHHAGRVAIKEILEMPDMMADCILRSYQERPVKEFGKKLFKKIPALLEKGRSARIKKALDKVWKENPVKDERAVHLFKQKK